MEIVKCLTGLGLTLRKTGRDQADNVSNSKDDVNEAVKNGNGAVEMRGGGGAVAIDDDDGAKQQ